MREIKDPATMEVKELAKSRHPDVDSVIDPAVVRAQLDALTDYYQSAYHFLFKQALYIADSPEAADDAVQEAFVDATERIFRGTEIRSLDAWFKTVVHHTCLKLKRPPTEPLAEEIASPESDVPSNIANHRQCIHDVYKALDEIPASQKSVFLLAEVHGLNYPEIAQRLGRTKDSVRQLLARARGYVRDAVGTEGLPLTAPVLRIEAESLQKSGYLPSLGGRLINRVHGLHSSLQALFERPSELFSQMIQPAVAAFAGVLVMGTLGGVGSTDRPVAQTDVVAPSSSDHGLVSPEPVPDRSPKQPESTGTAIGKQADPAAPKGNSPLSSKNSLIRGGNKGGSIQPGKAGGATSPQASQMGRKSSGPREDTGIPSPTEDDGIGDGDIYDNHDGISDVDVETIFDEEDVADVDEDTAPEDDDIDDSSTLDDEETGSSSAMPASPTENSRTEAATASFGDSSLAGKSES